MVTPDALLIDEQRSEITQTNAYGRIDENSTMLDRASAVSGTSLISSKVTKIWGLPVTSQTSVGAPNPYQNSGSLTYTPTIPRINIVFVNDGTVTGIKFD